MVSDFVGVKVAQHAEIALDIATHVHETDDADFPAGIVDIGERDRQIQRERQMVEAGAQMIGAPPCSFGRKAKPEPGLRLEQLRELLDGAAGLRTIDRTPAPQPHQTAQRGAGQAAKQ